jgi:cysteine desulfurase
MNKDTIYLDNAATTRLHAEVEREMQRAEHDLFYNSAASYGVSLMVKRELDAARSTIHRRLERAQRGTLVFTSGATEANNMAIFGKVTNASRHHIIVAAGEHSSVYAPSVYLKNSGFDVDYVPIEPSGLLDTAALKRLIRPNTAFFVFGMVNSDTGTLQNATQVTKAVRSVNPNIHIHCDAVQAFCKFDFDVKDLGFDTVAISAHKINGPKGIGALWVREGVNLRPQMYGGGQQDLRPGTESNAQILGFARAVAVFDTAENFERITSLHQHLIANLPAGCVVNGINNNPYITNIRLPRVYGQTVLNALSDLNICVGLGSACSKAGTKNRTLLAMGLTEEQTKQVLRISLGIFNTHDDINAFVHNLSKILANLGGA